LEKKKRVDAFLSEYEHPSLFKTREVARLTGYKKQTIQKWIRMGKISALRPWGPTADYYVPINEVNRIIKERGARQCME
jgi:excisionase family DNA binding protein